MEQGGIDWANQGMSLAIAVVAPILTTLLLSYAKPVRDLLRFRFARYKEQVDADALAIVRTHRLSKQPDWEFYKGMAGSFAWTIVILLMGTASIFAAPICFPARTPELPAAPSPRSEAGRSGLWRWRSFPLSAR
jgi:hypothetical protein